MIIILKHDIIYYDIYGTLWFFRPRRACWHDSRFSPWQWKTMIVRARSCWSMHRSHYIIIVLNINKFNHILHAICKIITIFVFFFVLFQCPISRKNCPKCTNNTQPSCNYWSRISERKTPISERTGIFHLPCNTPTPIKMGSTLKWNRRGKASSL